mmetsp:Transcript_81619/g.239637  ORF Transcript_81619/g.239637 Transcript_81619/m.239637 type:complete len:232 (+) Transcript_81619:450-1145(+)
MRSKQHLVRVEEHLHRGLLAICLAEHALRKQDLPAGRGRELERKPVRKQGGESQDGEQRTPQLRRGLTAAPTAASPRCKRRCRPVGGSSGTVAANLTGREQLHRQRLGQEAVQVLAEPALLRLRAAGDRGQARAQARELPHGQAPDVGRRLRQLVRRRPLQGAGVLEGTLQEVLRGQKRNAYPRTTRDVEQRSMDSWARNIPPLAEQCHSTQHDGVRMVLLNECNKLIQGV